MSLLDTDAQPFITATLAQIYRGQGRLLQARSIFEQLLRERPADEQVLAGLEQVRAEIAARLASAAGGDDGLRIALEGAALRCQWTITARGLERARLVLGGDGELVLRLVGFPFDPGLSLRDQPLDALAGDRLLPAPPGALVTSGAVGLLGGDERFVAITHAPPLALDGSDAPVAGPEET